MTLPIICFGLFAVMNGCFIYLFIFVNASFVVHIWDVFLNFCDSTTIFLNCNI